MMSATYRCTRPFLMSGREVQVGELVELDADLATWLLEKGRIESIDGRGVMRRPSVYYFRPDGAVASRPAPGVAAR